MASLQLSGWCNWSTNTTTKCGIRTRDITIMLHCCVAWTWPTRSKVAKAWT